MLMADHIIRSRSDKQMEFLIRSPEDKARFKEALFSLPEDEEIVVSFEFVNEGRFSFPGASKHALYHVWVNMWERCTNQNHTNYKHYGARGIRVCDEWKDFLQFVLDIGERPGPGYSLDRIDVNGHYCKENIRWATQKEQTRNRRITKFIEWRGESKSLAEWAEVLGIPSRVLQLRLRRRGWSVDEAFSTPLISPGWQKGMRRGSRVGG